MNINFNEIRRRFKFFFLLIPVFYNFAYCNLDFDLKLKDEVIIPLKLKKQSFIKGNYKSDLRIDKIELLDKKNSFLRRLDSPNQLEESFYFLTNDDESFFIKFYSKNNTNCHLKIEKILPTKYENRQEEILSPIIKEQKIKLQSNGNNDEFWEKVLKIGTPLLEQTTDGYIITFLYRGAKHNVRLLGGPVSDHVLLDKLGNSDIWYKSFKVEKGIRFSYQLAPDVPNIEGTAKEKRIAILSTAQIDVFNKNPYKYFGSFDTDKYKQLSTFEFNNDSFIDNSKELNNPKGKIINKKLKSEILNNERNISIYIPFEFNPKQKHKLLFVFDGIEYQSKVPLPTILDNLIQKKEILPTITIFIDNPSKKSRAIELPPNKDFADFMVKELLPFVKSIVDINHSAKDTILTGSSYGGLASMYIAFTYPEYFGNVLSQSGSFWWSKENESEPEGFIKDIIKEPKKDLNIYLNAGIYETGYSSIDILESNRHLRDILKAKGYANIIYEEYPTGHDYFAWKNNIINGLIKIQNNFNP